MRKNLTHAAGHTLCLSGLLMVCCVVLIVVKAFHTDAILPRITITLLVGLSLGALVLEDWIFPGEDHPEYLETGLLAMAAFGVMTWAVGLGDLSDAGKVGIAGGIVYSICLLFMTVMRAQLESASVKHKKAALTLSALLLLLASQSLAGIPILP